jgi:hypothetical protein
MWMLDAVGAMQGVYVERFGKCKPLFDFPHFHDFRISFVALHVQGYMGDKPLGEVRRFRWDWIPGWCVTKIAPHKASQSIA